jgi:hypothetical protein
MARGGLTRDNLAALNHNYDWANFLPRSLVLAWPINLLFPAHHLLAYHIALLVLAAGNLLCLAYLSHRLLPMRASRLALALYAAAPLRLWEVLGYPVDPLREFILLSGLVLMWLLCRPEKPWPVKGGTALGLGGVLFLGHLQQGIDLFLLASLVFVMVVALVREKGSWHTWRRGPVVYLLLAAALHLFSTRTYDHWQDRMDIRDWRHSLGPTAYIATGFNLNKIGEFDPHIWAMAVEAPSELKRTLMYAHVWSNIAYQPVRLFTLLFPVKAIKLFLIGYGSGIEQGLQAGGYAGASEWFKGMRLVYAPLFLCVVFLGGWRLLQSRLASPWQALLVCLLPLLSCLLFVVVGEVQSRYSYYTFFSLCLMAGVVVAPDAFPRTGRPSLATLAFRALGVAGLYILLAATAYGVTRVFLGDSTFLDVRRTVTQTSWESGASCDNDVPGGFRPYLRRMVLPARTYTSNDVIRSEVRTERTAQGVVRMSAMLWPGEMTEWASAFPCTVRFGGETVYTGPLLAKPRFLTSGWVATMENGGIPPITVEITCNSPVPLPQLRPLVALRWGFAYIESQSQKKKP